MACSTGRSLQRLLTELVAQRSAAVTVTTRTNIRRATTTSSASNLARCSSPCYSSSHDGNSRVASSVGVSKLSAGLRFQHSSSSSSSSSRNDKLASSSNNNNDSNDENSTDEERIPPPSPAAAARVASGDDKRVEGDSHERDGMEMSSGSPKSSLSLDLNDDEDDREGWIPPERPLAGDKGQSHVYAHVEEQGELKQLEIELKQLEEQPPTAAMTTTTTDNQQAKTTDEGPSSKIEGLIPDWLKTRRQRLQGTEMVKPQDSAAAKQKLLSEIPVLKHTFLTSKEIVTVIQALGGQDTTCIMDDLTKPRMAGALGMIITTGANHAQIRTLAEALLRQLRLRNLEDCGVIGAQEGIEGNVGDPYEDWLVLDCENYVVHFQTPLSRKALNIEGLWSGLDGMHKLDLSNEQEVDDFIAANPVPEWYNAGASPISDWDKQVKVLKKSRFAKKNSRESGAFRKRQRSVRWR